MTGQGRICAVLGPTNTGKTHYAIDRMLGHRTGIIGLPLRLLAREVYDKIVAIRGPSVVALVTGEERIVPPRTQYWVCTVEAMPEGTGPDFLAIDEIQLCADPERGHVFTDRLLRARGTHETLFLGSDTMRSKIADLVPGVQFMRRERMSSLSYAGSKKISRMPARSAIVGFSVDNVYAIAELLRRQKGGAAVVMGALSPRTRNAQVELYQNGDVDYLVATDAIGMGLNLDINHVAFSSLTKFDGRRMRMLMPNELAQIAGRAGRGMSDGSFGVTGEAPPLDPEVAEAIMDHRFTPVRHLQWRNAALNFATPEALIASLEEPPRIEGLHRAREAYDLIALRNLSMDAETRARASSPDAVRLLWDVCRIPDFRGISHAEHSSLLMQIFADLHQHGRVPDDWLARQIKRIDRTDGDIDTLSKRLAFIRTWTYVAQRSGWVADENHWRGETRAVEDRLSDALHERLTQRFVDRRTSVLLRRLKQKEALLAEVSDTGEVTVEGEFVGRLEGFRFRQDAKASGEEAKTINRAALQALAPHFHLRADKFYNAPDTEIDFTEQGGLMWGDQAVGKLVAGSDVLKPQVQVFVDDEAGQDVSEKVQRRLQHFIDRKIAALFEPLMNLQRDETLTGLARGFAFQMIEGLGILPRAQVADDVKQLDQDARGALRKHGLRFGQFTIFMPLLLKPAPTRLRLVLWSLANKLDEFPEAPPPGLVTVPTDASAPEGYATMAGYRVAGERSIRIDMLERLADMLRAEDTRAGFEAKADMLSITGMTLDQFADLMQGLGYKADKGEREKQRPVAEAPADAPQVVDDSAVTATPSEPAVEGATPDGTPQPLESDETTAGLQTEEVLAEVAPEATAPESTAPEGDAPAADTPAAAQDTAPEIEVFYTFTWGGGRSRRPGEQNQGGRQGRDGKRRGGDGPQGQGQGKRGGGKPQGAGGKKGGKGKPRDAGPKTFQSGPKRREKQIDPDNPFAAALKGLKTD
ncbi:ATP-dependent RNA helicase SUPV3L1/SUV3 [Pseudooceanicola nitratireducens]|jgi:ATP-dependent RNA helicase SUPV3L1/SUV3|uniref:ATP-dependent RNA helicase SUPV3L1/SUV3 n=1 Tax=Pseudooceanicola nitratireducens TaxID=517719 RepID=A0A1I1LXE6_9RHOB|nr:helicase-related protein [Pseudooceanicola nitratireducens]SEJ66504.1 ATP-dependent RNA helicase SUPV3L1/SUV3 [Pseudooceanicola nitratireducens]SFC77142.1 ATP-dependent RNA helicase SUPV3L1/SUV3 [Pseudooceanicola nitratireducens]